jgi:outer membrane autotransporter protein
MQQIKNGWDRVFTGYLGYHGASQRFSGVDSIQNGGLLGGTMTLYKGNFFNATTLSVGASVANNQTMYGHEDFAMMMSGVGNKTGYNFEFKEGKVILQPSLTMAYTFVNTFDYTNAAGVKISNKPLHTLQLSPGLKLVGNLNGGWQPYLSANMIWNLMGESDTTAGGVRLPQMSIKPYVQYGVGVQKRVKDHFMAYGQAMIQNGGRNGISLTAGFRWALGHNCKVKDKVQKEKTHKISITEKTVQPIEYKKILKQMTPEQKVSHGGVRQNTSRTVNSGVLKQL